MPWGAVAIAGASLVGGAMQSKAIGKAADASTAGARYAADLEQRRYVQTRTDMEPWRQAGTKALGSMQEMMYGDPSQQMESMRSAPGYQFRLDEGLKALQRSSLAGSVSGNTYRGLVEHGQNYASQEFGNRYNRLASLAGTGQTATQYTGQMGAQSAARQGGYAQSAADTRASAYLGKGQVMGQTLGQLASAGVGFYNSGGFDGFGGGGSATGNDFATLY